MRFSLRCLRAMLFTPALCVAALGQPSAPITAIRMPSYSVQVRAGEPPRLAIDRDGETVFEVPMVSGIASETQEERLSAIEYTVSQSAEREYQLNATAKSSLWSARRFTWRF